MGNVVLGLTIHCLSLHVLALYIYFGKKNRNYLSSVIEVMKIS